MKNITKIITKTVITSTSLLFSSALIAPAFAHHPMGGATPQTIWYGLLSGVGHPIIGLDHLAFIILVGLVSVFFVKTRLAPLSFIVATILGTLLVYVGIALPLAELVITASVVLVGSMVLSGRHFSPTLYAAIFAIAGLFHGGAYGEAIIGAEATPLISYVIGFGITQYAIILAAGWTARAAWKATNPAALYPRLAGAVAAGVGLAFFIETVEGLI